jgi:6,7-dimethyl-8-ribityllumazine synthase
MLKSVHVGSYVLRPEDFRVVIYFFRSVGFDFALRARSAIFMAAQGAFMIRESRSDQSAVGLDQPTGFSKHLAIEVSNPDVVLDVANKMNLKVSSDALPKVSERKFAVELPGEITISVYGKPDRPLPALEGKLNGKGRRFAIVMSRFNSFITERLLQGAMDGLLRCSAARKDIEIVRVPGAFEIPSAARTLAQTKKYDAVICLGCLLRGDTAHYDVIVNEVTRGIGQSAQESGVPHAFGVLTCETLEQAIDRAGLKMGNKGLEAALAAVEMANLTKAVVGRSSLVAGKDAGTKAVSSQLSALRKTRKPELPIHTKKRGR